MRALATTALALAACSIPTKVLVQDAGTDPGIDAVIGTGPDTTITSGPPTTNNQVGLTTFTFTASEPDVSYECSLDDATFAACPNPYRTWIDDGSHVLSVRAKNAAGDVDATPATYAWTSKLANLVFIAPNVKVGANFGGLAGVDAFCAQAALQAGLHGTYIAWASTSTVDAIDRLGAARGWVRVDGKPFADTKTDVGAGTMFYPIELDASGNRLPTTTIVTNTTAAGRNDFSMGCADWTDEANTEANVGAGTSSGGSGRWTAENSTKCAGAPLSLYCFGIDRRTTVAPPPPPQSSRLAFVSNGTFTPGAGRGAADGLCTQEAIQAGLPGAFKALLGTSTAGALDRFSSTGGPWVRPDGVAIAPTAGALFDPTLEAFDAPINQTAAGAYLADGSSGTIIAWATPPLTKPALDSCTDWTSPSGVDSWGSTLYPASADLGVTFGVPTSSCNSSEHVLCFQQ
jgi:hypothetical protein